MSDLFKSDYVTSSGTSAQPPAPPATSSVPPSTASQKVMLDPAALGVEATRYGLGKPARVVIKGKITRD